jgi:hypothetical protein
MTKQKEDYIVKGSIVLFFVLYMIGYAWLIEPKENTEKNTVKNAMIPQQERRQTERHQLKSLPADWPDTCEHYVCEFDEASYYQNHYDEYQDDPEDEIRFPPEIFDANDD